MIRRKHDTAGDVAAGIEASATADYKLGLSVSRAFGDRDFKAPHALVSADPEIHTIELSKESDLFLILGCDGVWDVLSNKEAVEVVAAHLALFDAKKASLALVEAAKERGSGDDLTAHVIVFQENKHRIAGIMEELPEDDADA
eukprot:jgi/Bigna1/129634/aug1.9_g4342